MDGVFAGRAVAEIVLFDVLEVVVGGRGRAEGGGGLFEVVAEEGGQGGVVLHLCYRVLLFFLLHWTTFIIFR